MKAYQYFRLFYGVVFVLGLLSSFQGHSSEEELLPNVRKARIEAPTQAEVEHCLLSYTGLSMDGGGIRGLFSALVLKKIEETIHGFAKDWGWEEQKNLRIHEYFDSIGGTSIGGILALSLVAPRYEDNILLHEPSKTLEEWINFIKENRKKIIPPKWFKFAQGWHKALYSAEGFREAMLEGFADGQLKHVLTDVLVTSLDFNTRKPFFFEKRKALQASKDNFYIRDVALATASVCAHFPAAVISPVGDENAFIKRTLIDGGISFDDTSQFVFNRLVAKMQENRGRVSLESVFLLSLSNGFKIVSDTTVNPGLVDLAFRIADHLHSGAASVINTEMAYLLGEQFQRVQPAELETVKFDDMSDVAWDKIEDIAQKCDVSEIARQLMIIKQKKLNSKN